MLPISVNFNAFWQHEYLNSLRNLPLFLVIKAVLAKHPKPCGEAKVWGLAPMMMPWKGGHVTAAASRKTNPLTSVQPLPQIWPHEVEQPRRWR